MWPFTTRTPGRVARQKLNVGQSTLAELRAICLNDIADGEPRGDLRIPTLQEYARVCKRYGKVSVLELKDDFTRAQLEEIIAILRAEGQLENVVFIAFALENLLRLREILPEQPGAVFGEPHGGRRGAGASRTRAGLGRALCRGGRSPGAAFARAWAEGQLLDSGRAGRSAAPRSPWAWIISPAISGRRRLTRQPLRPVAGFPQNGLTRLKTPRELTFNTDCDTVRLGDTI